MSSWKVGLVTTLTKAREAYRSGDDERACWLLAKVLDKLREKKGTPALPGSLAKDWIAQVKGIRGEVCADGRDRSRQAPALALPRFPRDRWLRRRYR